MPTWPSPEAFAAEVARLDHTISNEMRAATRKMATDAERLAAAEARKDLGGDTRFSGWAGRDLANLKVRRARDGVSHWLFPSRKSAGPWRVAEQGRNTGQAPRTPFLGPGVNRRTGITSRTASGGVRKVRVTGSGRWNGWTPAFGTASRAGVQMGDIAEKVGMRAATRATRRHFDVS